MTDRLLETVGEDRLPGSGGRRRDRCPPGSCSAPAGSTSTASDQRCRSPAGHPPPAAACRSRRKTKRSHRTIRLDPDTVAALTRHQGAQKVERSLAGEYVDHDLVFPDDLGRALSPWRLTEAFGVLRAAAGIRPGRLHDLRHTSATYAHVLRRSDERAAKVMAAVPAGALDSGASAEAALTRFLCGVVQKS